MNRKIAIIGAGGHGKVVGEIALLNNFNIIDFFDDNVSEIKDYPFKILGDLNNLKKNFREYDFFFVAIGDNKIRAKKIEWLITNKKNIVNLIHPKSTISVYTNLENGICVMANAVINPGTSIKEGVIINTSSSIDHDCFIDEYSHISPNSSLSGNVSVGKFSHLGTGTSVHPGIKIGNNVKTGIGSRIYQNIFDGKVFKN